MLEVTVCVSGNGGNLRTILLGASNEYVVNRVIADRPCGATSVAEKFSIPTQVVPRSEILNNPNALIGSVPATTKLIVLAGFLTVLPRAVVERWPRQIINTHPSLLPDFGGPGFYGVRVHEAVLESGRASSGCTVHFVDCGVDTGEIIAQATLDVMPGESAWSLGARVFELEGPLLVACIRDIATSQHT